MDRYIATVYLNFRRQTQIQSFSSLFKCEKFEQSRFYLLRIALKNNQKEATPIEECN